MFRYILLIVCMLETTNAAADAFYVAVRFECDRKNDFVAVHYLGAYNEDGEALIAGLGENGIAPWKLVEVTADRITKQSTVTKECLLSDGKYKVEIGPAPGNSNIQGRCGGEMSAWTEISKASKVLVRSGFAPDCHDMESPIRTRVLWRVGAKEAEITEVSNEEFYR